jgi:hypothetical protein
MSRDLRLGLIESEGHWQQMFEPYAYDFHEALSQKYGKISRVYGIFGVGIGLFGISQRIALMA